MAHKKAAGSAKNLRDSNPKYRGVKVYGGQPVTAGDIIIRQKGDKFKLGNNVYKGRDFTIHAGTDGIVHFGKKNYTRFDGKVYLKTYVEVLQNTTNAHTQKITHNQSSQSATAPKSTPKGAVSAPSKDDLTTKTVSELKDIAKSMDLSGYSTLKKAELIDFINTAK